MPSSIKDVSGDTSTTTSHPLPSVEGVPKERVAAASLQQNDSRSTLPAGGVEQERVDPFTLQVIDQLFPGHHGVKFLAALLRLATVKQRTLPELGVPETADVAVITVQSIRTLARQIGLSYDTAEKYIVVLCYLRLLYKQRHRRQIVLHFPLCRCQLPEPDVLDQVQEMRPASQTPRYRPKVRSFAHQVKRRFVLLRQKGQLATPLSIPMATPTKQLPDRLPQLLMEDIRQILEEEVDSETGSRLSLKIENAVHYRCTLSMSRLSHTNGDSEDEEGIVEGTLQTQKSPFSGRIVDSERKAPSQHSRLSHTCGDSDHPDHQRATSDSPVLPHKATFSEPRAQKGDSERTPPLAQSRLSLKKDDSEVSMLRTIDTKKATLSTASVSQSRLLKEKGDSLAQKGDFASVSLDARAPNVNVIKILESITTLNVSMAARFCCRVFDEPVSKQGIYCKLFRDIEHDVPAISAAFFYTLAHRQDGTIHNPAAVFVQRCKDYHSTGIPDEAASLVVEYGHLSYTQVQETFQALHASISSASATASVALAASGLSALSTSSRSSKSLSTRSTPSTPSSLPPLTAKSVLVHLSLRAGGGMTGEQIRRLLEVVARDRRVALCRSQVVALADHSYALVLDNTVSHTIRQTAFYAEQEWQERTNGLKDCFALFESAQQGPEPARPSLRERLEQLRQTVPSTRKKETS